MYRAAPLTACTPQAEEQEPVMLPSPSQGKQTQDFKEENFCAMLEVLKSSPGFGWPQLSTLQEPGETPGCSLLQILCSKRKKKELYGSDQISDFTGFSAWGKKDILLWLEGTMKRKLHWAVK